ncbi:replication-relaxation family protein [Planomicrobium sp. CPCC 101079]|uniref:replication-relaxation family protein n=1 Tax=Planomicrobium sp. CPCC 101079 TaxID=2599618 RepID=UPI0016493197|nr:replication-relaxation family protein [Planomicrobium sp. CPCC 101079]
MENKILKKGKGRSRIEVKPSEVEMLIILERQHLLSTSQLFRYYTELCFGKSHSYAFKNRMRKFEDFKLIKSAKFAEGFDGDRFKYYTLGSAGIELLQEKGHLSDDYNKNRMYSHLNKKNVQHFLMTQEVVLRIMAAGMARLSTSMHKTKGLSLKMISLSPAEHPYERWVPKASGTFNRNNKGAAHARAASYTRSSSSKSEMGFTSTMIKPDWIMKRTFEDTNNTRVINIELDTGTEQWPQIIDKIWRYCYVAEENKDAFHVVAFVMPDETYSLRNKYGDRSQRLQNMNISLNSDTKLQERLKEVGLIVVFESLKNIGYLLASALEPEIFMED